MPPPHPGLTRTEAPLPGTYAPRCTPRTSVVYAKKHELPWYIYYGTASLLLATLRRSLPQFEAAMRSEDYETQARATRLLNNALDQQRPARRPEGITHGTAQDNTGHHRSSSWCVRCGLGGSSCALTENPPSYTTDDAYGSVEGLGAGVEYRPPRPVLAPHGPPQSAGLIALASQTGGRLKLEALRKASNRGLPGTASRSKARPNDGGNDNHPNR
ncbi:hypothetical protein HPB48_002513 [Haemaphysalis longicornis]|uniref:Uncharacterized protein n=1 Tax=Haemaphysalis longicornis TaxID=44386 RepID=A0A9J6G7Z2_HAELO|nr:hypothetical protein HPB48_002513 [Haemaphysalis longicornis]